MTSLGILTKLKRLNRMYALPRAAVTFEEWQRGQHYDLDVMTEVELDVELFRVRRRLTAEIEADLTPTPWLVERRRRVLEALQQRRFGGRQPRPWPENRARGA